MPAPATSAVLARLRFRGEWRRYQRFALEAFERDVAAGRTRTHLVAPPGSGKTLLGVELVRRLGRPALVLAPNTAIQAQWIRSVELFRGDGDTEPVAGAEPGVPIACLSYQALSQLDDPGAVLGDLAAERWAAERASVTSEEPSVVARQAAGWTGEAARRRRRELARITASFKREIATGGSGRDSEVAHELTLEVERLVDRVLLEGGVELIDALAAETARDGSERLGLHTGAPNVGRAGKLAREHPQAWSRSA